VWASSFGSFFSTWKKTNQKHIERSLERRPVAALCFIKRRLSYCLEAVSEFQFVFRGKAPLDEKAEHIQSYVSILKKAATPLWDVRWDFETASNQDLQ